MYSLDWLYQLVSRIHMGTHILSKVRSAYSQLAPEKQDRLYLPQLERMVSTLKHRLYHSSCTIVKLLKSHPFG